MALPEKKLENPARPLVLDEELAQEIIRGVQKTFVDMFRTQVTPGAHRFGDDLTVAGDVSGMVGMVQDKVEGTTAVSFEKSAICGILSTLYEKSFEEIEKPVRDGVGEITNIIYCLIKRYLNARGHRLKMAIPNVVLGKDHNITSMHENGRSLLIPFTAPKGRFYILVTLQSS